MRSLIERLTRNGNQKQKGKTSKIGATKALVIATLLILTIQFVSAEPLLISAEVKPAKPAVGDTIGVYLTILGQQDESVQVVTKLKDPTFKVVDMLTKEDILYNAIKSDTIDFKISKGQSVKITIIGEMPNVKTLAVLFPNAYRVEVKTTTPNPTPTKTLESNPVYSGKEELWKKYGELYAKYEKVKDAISERLQLIIEEKFKNAKSKLETGQLEDVRIILNEIEGLLTVQPNDGSAVLIAAILAAIVGAGFLIWRYYQPAKGSEEEELIQTNFRLLR